MIHALRDGDRDALMALCRDHLLPSRTPIWRRNGSAVRLSCRYARNSLSRHGVVKSSRYLRVSLRFAPSPDVYG